MGNSGKLVSVIMPVYNRQNLVSASVDSVLQQTYSPVELILINDGSTDDTAKVLDGYAERYPEQIKVIHQQNTGQVVARNNGITLAKGEYVAFLDSDDTWLADKLLKQMPLFQSGVGLVYSGIYEVAEDGHVLSEIIPPIDMRGDIFYKLLVKNGMTGGSVVISHEALDDVGLFDANLKAAENWDLWIRITKKYKADFIAEPLVCYLRHQGNMSADSDMMSMATKFIYEKHIPETTNDQRLQHARSQAYAYLHYSAGIVAFGRGDYGAARREFNLCWQYVPRYKDSIERYFRCFLGRRVNLIFSYLRRMIQ